MRTSLVSQKARPEAEATSSCALATPGQWHPVAMGHLGAEARVVGVKASVPPRVELELRSANGATRRLLLPLTDARLPAALQSEARAQMARGALVDLAGAPEAQQVQRGGWVSRTPLGRTYIWQTILRVTAPENQPMPTREEWITALKAKAVPRGVATALLAVNLASGAMGVGAALGTLALGVGLDAFFGGFVRTWNRFMKAVGDERGFWYQNAVNFLNGQTWNAAFRFIAHVDNPRNVASPLSFAYVGEALTVGGLSIATDTLARRGYDKLLDKGWLTEAQRDRVALARDAIFATVQTLLGLGGGPALWAGFAVQVAFELALWRVGQAAPKNVYPQGTSQLGALRALAAAIRATLRRKRHETPATWLGDVFRATQDANVRAKEAPTPVIAKVRPAVNERPFVYVPGDSTRPPKR